MWVNRASLIIVNKVDVSATILKIQGTLNASNLGLIAILRVLLIWRREEGACKVVM